MTDAQIQGALYLCNYDPGPLDGNPNGPLGEAATMRAQEGYGIDVDGIPGGITQGKLSGQVATYQSILKNRGYYHGEIDGLWGTLTDQAVKAFQRDRGLSADGIVGQETFPQLMAAGGAGNTQESGGNFGVFISCSNQNDNQYLIGGISEKQYCEDFYNNNLKQALGQYGIVCYDANEKTLRERNAVCNDLFGQGKIKYSIVIHTNAGGGNGIEVYANPDKASQGHRLGVEICKEVSALGRANRGVKTDTSLIEYSVDAPVAYCELDFHDTEAGCNHLLNRKREIAKAMAKAIASKQEIEAPVPAPPQSTGLIYFGPDEFKCECGCGGDVSPELKQKMDNARGILGSPLIITSGYRCAYQNEVDGGVPDSLHMYGEAADCYSPGIGVETVRAALKSAGLGVGIYYSSQFCHGQLPNWDFIGD